MKYVIVVEKVVPLTYEGQAQDSVTELMRLTTPKRECLVEMYNLLTTANKSDRISVRLEEHATRDVPYFHRKSVYDKE
jgi:hypothetical protein